MLAFNIQQVECVIKYLFIRSLSPSLFLLHLSVCDLCQIKSRTKNGAIRKIYIDWLLWFLAKGWMIFGIWLIFWMEFGNRFSIISTLNLQISWNFPMIHPDQPLPLTLTHIPSHHELKMNRFVNNLFSVLRRWHFYCSPLIKILECRRCC